MTPNPGDAVIVDFDDGHGDTRLVVERVNADGGVVTDEGWLWPDGLAGMTRDEDGVWRET